VVLVVSEEVREAINARQPVVALESTIIAHGLPRPRNLQVALELEDVVRRQGAVPATIAVLDGRPLAGLDKEQLERVANEDGIRKLGHRDLPLAVAAGVSGATTVSATAQLAALAGVEVFATGGLGGVHREWTTTQDESAAKSYWHQDVMPPIKDPARPCKPGIDYLRSTKDKNIAKVPICVDQSRQAQVAAGGTYYWYFMHGSSQKRGWWKNELFGDGHCELRTRNGANATAWFPEVARSLARVPAVPTS